VRVCLSLPFPGIDETVKIVESMGGFCKGYKIDISKKEEVYKAADEIRMSVGDVSMSSCWI
jgi:all-trans-retinol dehydrogenase (NAD+)